MNKSLVEQIYRLLFPPEGAIPLKAKANINAIDARIHELEELAAGKALAGMNRRVWNPRDSKLLTEQIIQLRESCDPPMSFKEVTTRLGDPISVEATRARYEEYKKGVQKAAISVPEVARPEIETLDHIVEADEMILIELKPVEKAEPVQADTPPDQQEQNTCSMGWTIDAQRGVLVKDPTTRNYRIVEETDEVPILPKPEKAEIPAVKVTESDMPSEDLSDLIRPLMAKGMGAKTIAQEINDSHGLNVTWQDVRACMVQIGKNQKRSSPEPTPAKENDLDFNRIADFKILDMKKRGAMDFEIAQSLTRNPGGQWDATKVADRYNQLKAEGAA